MTELERERARRKEVQAALDRCQEDLREAIRINQAAEEEEILGKERVLPCRGCTHQMRHHDENDRCMLCPCPEFSYEETEER